MDAAMVADLGTGSAVIAAGAITLTRPAARVTGLLLTATGAAWLAGSAVDALVFLHRGPLFHLLLAYPRLRVGGRARAGIVLTAYGTAAVEPLGAIRIRDDGPVDSRRSRGRATVARQRRHRATRRGIGGGRRARG